MRAPSRRALPRRRRLEHAAAAPELPLHHHPGGDRLTLTIEVTRYQWADEWQWIRDIGADGIVFYTVRNPDEINDEGKPAIVMNLQQPFSRDGPKHYAGAKVEEIQSNRANIWKWNGDREAPTLDPSYLVVVPHLFRVHSYLRAGRLDLCSDSTVVVA